MIFLHCVGLKCPTQIAGMLHAGTHLHAEAVSKPNRKDAPIIILDCVYTYGYVKAPGADVLVRLPSKPLPQTTGYV